MNSKKESFKHLNRAYYSYYSKYIKGREGTK
jgi:hypothetical protein